MKSKILLYLLTFTTVALFSFISDSEWQLYKSVDGINIYSKTQTAVEKGIAKKYLLFKYENTTGNFVEVSWKLNVWYNGVCRACDLPSPNEYELSLQLKAKETKTGSVNSASKIYKVFYSSDSEGIAPLDKFEFENLKVKVVK